MSGLFGGGKSGPSAQQLELERMQLEQERAAAAKLKEEQRKEELQKQRLSRQRQGGAQFLSSGFKGFTLFGESNKKGTLG